MTTQIRAIGANFGNSGLEMVMPVSGMRGWLFPSGEYPVRNRVRGGQSATIIGTPEISDTHSTLNFTDHIQTPLLETADMTIYLVFKNEATLSGTDLPTLISNFQFGASVWSGFGIYCSAGSGAGRISMTNMRADAPNPDDSEAVFLDNPNINNWLFLAATIGAGAGQNLYNMTNGLSVTEADVRSRVVNSRPIKIGASYTGTARYGASSNAFTGVADRVHTTEERTTVYQLVKAWMAELETPILI